MKEESTTARVIILQEVALTRANKERWNKKYPDANLSDEELAELFDLFDRRKPRMPKPDIFTYKDYDTLRQTLDQAEKIKAKEKDTAYSGGLAKPRVPFSGDETVFYQSPRLVAYVAETHSIVYRHCKDQEWCIARGGESNSHHWHEYSFKSENPEAFSAYMGVIEDRSVPLDSEVSQVAIQITDEGVIDSFWTKDNKERDGSELIDAYKKEYHALGLDESEGAAIEEELQAVKEAVKGLDHGTFVDRAAVSDFKERAESLVDAYIRDDLEESFTARAILLQEIAFTRANKERWNKKYPEANLDDDELTDLFSLFDRRKPRMPKPDIFAYKDYETLRQALDQSEKIRAKEVGQDNGGLAQPRVPFSGDETIVYQSPRLVAYVAQTREIMHRHCKDQEWCIARNHSPHWGTYSFKADSSDHYSAYMGVIEDRAVPLDSEVSQVAVQITDDTDDKTFSIDKFWTRQNDEYYGSSMIGVWQAAYEADGLDEDEEDAVEEELKKVQDAFSDLDHEAFVETARSKTSYDFDEARTTYSNNGDGGLYRWLIANGVESLDQMRRLLSEMGDDEEDLKLALHGVALAHPTYRGTLEESIASAMNYALLDQIKDVREAAGLSFYLSDSDRSAIRDYFADYSAPELLDEYAPVDENLDVNRNQVILLTNAHYIKKDRPGSLYYGDPRAWVFALAYENKLNEKGTYSDSFQGQAETLVEMYADMVRVLDKGLASEIDWEGSIEDIQAVIKAARNNS